MAQSTDTPSGPIAAPLWNVVAGVGILMAALMHTGTVHWLVWPIAFACMVYGLVLAMGSRHDPRGSIGLTAFVSPVVASAYAAYLLQLQ